MNGQRQAASQTAAPPRAAAAPAAPLPSPLRGGARRLAPVLVGIVLTWTVFQLANPNFLTPFNLTNLMLQIAAVGTISVGVVFVLLLGEIDLSVGWTSGFAAAVMAVLNVKQGLPAPVAIVAGLAVGVGVGLVNGLFVTRFGIPSFVVTLAGLLAWQGALLFTLGETGTINLNDPTIVGIANTFLAPGAGWALIAAVIALHALAVVSLRRRRAATGLPLESAAVAAARVGVPAAALVAAGAVFNAGRGLPLAALIFVGFVAVCELVIRRTRFGRHVFAVGGNEEAARRAGIAVNRVKTAVFVLTSTFAAAGGILAASRLLAVNQSSGAGDVLLNSIAAPVIAGTSLFGGRGSMWSALLGSILIGSISNGMDLLALSSDIKFMVTGAVLLAAVTVDALARRRRPPGEA